jgi:predicted alpha/beta-hydrolase family hydrolase
VACRTALAGGAAAALALAFPLHPPGRPERSRADELQAAADVLPVLVVQGATDAFGRPAEFPAGVPVVEVPGAGHPLKSAAAPAAIDRAVGWLVTTCAAAGRTRRGIGAAARAL